MSKLPEFEKKKEEILVINESLGFDELDIVERKLLIETLVQKVVIDKNKKVTVTLQPPLHSLKFHAPY